jgi:hypothetical protein
MKPFFEYTHPTLEELEKKSDHIFKLYEGQPPEADYDLNSNSSQIPFAMLKEFGECWLGKVNLYSDDILPFKLTQYKADGKVNLYNFSFDYCIPKHDPILEKMIHDRATCTLPYSGKRDMARIKAIYDRIEKLKGHLLAWS